MSLDIVNCLGERVLPISTAQPYKSPPLDRSEKNNYFTLVFVSGIKLISFKKLRESGWRVIYWLPKCFPNPYADANKVTRDNRLKNNSAFSHFFMHQINSRMYI